MDELPDLSRISIEQKDALIRFLFGEVNRLSAQVTALSSQVMELKARQNKNSHNSSKPPSTDGLTKKTQSLREASGKKPGGQPGHKGSTLKRVATPTQVIVHKLPAQCDRCHCALVPEHAQVAHRRQVFDVPVTALDVIEHRTLALTCHCGQHHASEFPANVTEAAQYGPNLRALGVHLTQVQLLPFARASQLIGELYKVTVSPGTLVAWVRQAHAALQATADDIAEHLVGAPVVHADESGLRVQGKLHWLHVVASQTHTWYGIHGKRGMEAIGAHGILPRRRAVTVHDCWKPYWQLDCVHALCNAHLLRELVYVKQVTAQAWPQQMTDLLRTANKISNASRRQNMPLAPEVVAAFRTLYDDILRQAQCLHPAAAPSPGKRGSSKQSVAFNLLRRLREHAGVVLLFVGDPAVPFTNNVGERAIRMPKVKQKISGCFRTRHGAERFSVIRSCLDTFHKQGHSMLDVLRRAFSGNPLQLATG